MTTETARQDRFPWQRFIHPRFWPTWIGIGILRLLSLLPFNIQLAIGRQLGQLTRYLLPRRVHIARTNIRLCFPDLSAGQQKQLLNKHFEAIGMGIFETALSWWGSDDELKSRVRIEGIEHIKHVRESGAGLLMVTGHFSMMELTGHMLGLHNPTGALYRPMKNPLSDLLLLRARQRRLAPLLTRDNTRTMTRCLRRGEAIFYAYDQNYGLDHALFIPFFGVPAATITATSRFAAMGRAKVIAYFPRRQADGSYVITVHPPLEGFGAGNDEQDTRRLNTLLEQAILEAPEQYFWIHRRFKTRPEGLDTVY